MSSAFGRGSFIIGRLSSFFAEKTPRLPWGEVTGRKSCQLIGWGRLQVRSYVRERKCVLTILRILLEATVICLASLFIIGFRSQQGLARYALRDDRINGTLFDPPIRQLTRSSVWHLAGGP